MKRECEAVSGESKALILIHIDTLRRDHLGCYGYSRETSPNIDKLAEEGVVCENAYSTDVPTIPYYTSTFTGMRGTSTGVVWEEDLSPGIQFFTRSLAANGTLTAAVSTLSLWKPWFTKDFHIFMNPVAGQPRRIQQVDADEINSYAFKFIRENRDRNFFLWLHYWDPHTYYSPPEEYRDMFKRASWTPPNYLEMDWSESQYFLPEVRKLWEAKYRYGYLYLGLPTPSEEGRGEAKIDYELLVNLYDGEIAYVDKCIGDLMSTIEDCRLTDRVMVIVTSDHGECHGEHDDIFNHVDVYEPTVHVPLVIWSPTHLPSGVRLNGLVQNIDLAPTILDFFGVEKPQALEGLSLIPYLTGESCGPIRRYVFSDTGLAQCSRMIFDGRWKLVETIHRGLWEKYANPELYNLEKDPLEKKNLCLVEREKTDELQLVLHRSLMERLNHRPDPLRITAQKKPPQYRRAMKFLGLNEEKLESLRKKYGKEKQPKGLTPVWK